VAGSIVSGIATGKIGYYTQSFAYVSAVAMPMGAWADLDAESRHWTCRVDRVAGVVRLLTQAGDAASPTRRSDGTRVRQRPDYDGSWSFSCRRGGAVFISVGQNVLTSHLVSGILGLVGGLDPAVVVSTGATDLRDLVPAEQLPVVLEMYNGALRWAFLISRGLVAVTILWALGLEWKSVKRNGAVVAQGDEVEDVEK
jgi:hypothetical protein